MTVNNEIRAGPPKCPVCNEHEEIWVPKWSDGDRFLWICPNYCNINNFAQEASDS